MRGNKQAGPALFLLFLAVVVFPVPGRGRQGIGKTNVEVSGRVRLVGSRPGMELVITGENREWYVKPKDQKKLMKFQQQIVRVKGKEYFVDLWFANGVFAGRRYTLENITILRSRQRKNGPETPKN
jgi:hypothetical protein